MFTVLILLALLAAVAYEVWSRRKQLRLRDELGLPGPPVNFFQGNVDYIYNMMKEKGIESVPDVFPTLVKEYGSTFGFYRGSTLEVITADPEAIKEIFVTKFSNFVARKANIFMDVYPFKESVLNIGETGPHGVGWRDIRTAVNTIFSPSKIKKMHGLMTRRIGGFIDNMPHTGTGQAATDVVAEYQAIMMDLTGEAIFGQEDTACVTDRSTDIYNLARSFMNAFRLDQSRFMQLTYMFPFLISLRKFSEFGKYETSVLALLSEIITERQKERADGKTREAKDLVDTLIEESEKRVANGEAPFTHDIIVSNSFAFFLAGYETSSSTLSYMTHMLGQHQRVQTTLLEELEEAFPAGEKIDIERLMKLPYLHAVFCETLRRYPPALTITGRTCAKDTTLCGGKYRVPAGTTVLVPVNCHLWNEEVYENARDFIPERFLDERTVSHNFLPFGLGPRNCVGARFAETVVKMIIASLVRRFHVRPDPEHTELKVTHMNAMLAPLGGKVFVRLEPRRA